MNTLQELPMNRDDVLRQIMKHAVGGHTVGGYHQFCNDPSHAKNILVSSLFVVRPTISRSPEQEESFENEGGRYGLNPEQTHSHEFAYDWHDDCFQCSREGERI